MRKFSETLRRAILITGLVWFLLFLVMCLFDPYAFPNNDREITKIKEELPLAMARWEANGSTDYTIDVQGFVHLGCIYEHTITVSNNKIVNIQRNTRDPGFSPTVSLGISEPEDGFCIYEKLLIPEMLKQVEDELNKIDSMDYELRVTFDPVTGYVTSYTYNANVGHGLLTTGSDGYAWFKFRNYRPTTSHSKP